METISRCLLTFILNSLWQIPLITLFGALICHFIRKGPASDRNIVWVVAMVAALLIPAASIRLPLSSGVGAVSQNIIPAPPLSAANDAPVFRYRPIAVPAVAPPRTVSFSSAAVTALLAVYLLFLLFRIGRLLAALSRTSRIRNRAVAAVPSQSIASVWKRSEAAFDVDEIELLQSDSVSGPLTTGAFRKAIILPESLLNESSEDVLATAIGHEMAHAARRDFGWNVLCELLYAPVSFHPAAMYLHRAIARTRELACDELVTERLLKPDAYARSIVSIAATMTALQRPGYTLGVFDGDILEERIRRLVEGRRSIRRSGAVLVACGCAALAICAIVTSTLAISARAQNAAGGDVKLGGDAYNSGDFRAAVAHFDNAVQTDPSNVSAKLFLANALMREFYSEKGPPNSPLLILARRQYLDTLAADPQNKRGVEGLIAIAMNTKQPKEAHDWATKLIQAYPTDKVGYYTIGVLDWAEVYPQFAQSRQEAGGDPHEYSIPDASVRKNLRDHFMPQIDEGFHMLQTALELDPNYADAMAYMNLLDRLKAGIVDNPDEAQMWIAKADEWVGHVMELRRQGRAANSQQISSLDVNAPPPGPPSATGVMAGPPKPPPPPPAPGLAAPAGNDTVSPMPPPIARKSAEKSALFWQVAGDSGVTANALVRQLNDKGFIAAPFSFREDHLTRVMAGPYPNDQSLQRAKIALETSGFHPLRVW